MTKAKILIVDDNAELLEFLSLLLTMNKYDVIGATTKNEILTRLIEFAPDIILMDVLLNGIDGREVCKEIKQLKQGVHVILLSANPKLLERYEECQADDIIEKPFDITKVLEKINNSLQLKSA